MSADELNESLIQLKLIRARAAKMLGVSLRTVQGWTGGEYPVPEPVAKLIRCYVQHPELMEKTK